MFSPYYGEAIAEWILSSIEQQVANGANLANGIDIVEIGGGTGRLSLDVLNTLAVRHPAAYKHTQYTSVELTPQLSSQQRQLHEQHGAHTSRFRSNNTSFTRFKQARERSTSMQFVVACEVLDNLAHDKLFVPRDYNFEAAQQAWIDIDRDTGKRIE